MKTKLLLIRKINVRADLLDKSGLTGFLKGQPLKISPKAWDKEHGITHYGYILENLMLKDLETLNNFAGNQDGCSVLDVTDNNITQALADVGLHENDLA